MLANPISSVLTVCARLLFSRVSVLFGLFCFRFSSLPLLCFVFLSHSNERMKERNSLCSRVAGREGWLLLILLLRPRKVWLLLVPSLRLRKDMAAEEATAGRVAQLVPGCCWCWPWFSRGHY